MQTLNDLLFRAREISAGRADLLSVRLGGRRESLSSSDFFANVHALALHLEAQGLDPGDRVAIYSENRPEWHLVDFAAHLLGLVVVPLYPTLSPQQVAYILRNSGSRWVFFSDVTKRKLLMGLESTLTAQLQMVSFDGKAALPGGFSITRLIGQGAEKRGAIPMQRFRGRVAPEDLASLVYTSDTTGDPKGVMLSHGNFVANILGCAEKFSLGPRDVALSLLPLSHVFQRTVDYLCFHQGVSIHYVPAIERVTTALRSVRPTVLIAIPRFYERIYQHALVRAAKEPPLRRRLFAWALRVGRGYAEGDARRSRRLLLRLQQRLTKGWVLRKVAQRFGGRLRLPICGGAALDREVGEFFVAAGLTIYAGYGLTESSPVLSASSPGRWRQGAVGQALRGVELRIAEDGEILARGPNIMFGYWQNPSATEEVLDAEGWLHTGDLGHIDAEGFLFITGRQTIL